jgi:predicted  nucleic acid-binding Zn-ribbon protein
MVLGLAWISYSVFREDANAAENDAQLNELRAAVNDAWNNRTFEQKGFSRARIVAAYNAYMQRRLGGTPGSEFMDLLLIEQYCEVVGDLGGGTAALPRDPAAVAAEARRAQEAARQRREAMLQQLSTQESKLMSDRGSAMSRYAGLVAQANRLRAQIHNDESELSNENDQLGRIPGRIEEQRGWIERQQNAIAGNQALSAAQVDAFQKIIRQAMGYSRATSILSDPSSPYAAPQLQDVVKPAVERAIAAFRSLRINGPALDALIQTDESITVENAAQELQALAQTLTAQLGLLQASHGATATRLSSGLASLQNTLGELESWRTNVQNSIVALQQRISAGQGSLADLERDRKKKYDEIQQLDRDIANIEQQINALQQQQ